MLGAIPALWVTPGRAGGGFGGARWRGRGGEGEKRESEAAAPARRSRRMRCQGPAARAARRSRLAAGGRQHPRLPGAGIWRSRCSRDGGWRPDPVEEPPSPAGPPVAPRRAAADPPCPDAWEQIPATAPLGAGKFPAPELGPVLESCSGCSHGMGMGTEKGSCAPRRGFGGCSALFPMAKPDGDPGRGAALPARRRWSCSWLHQPKASPVGDTRKRPGAPRHPSLVGFNPLGGRNPTGG